jgi:hypothetical protein
MTAQPRNRHVYYDNVLATVVMRAPVACGSGGGGIAWGFTLNHTTISNTALGRRRAVFLECWRWRNFKFGYVDHYRQHG